MAAGPAQFAHGNLQALGDGYGAGGEQIVKGLITGDEGQTVGHFETFLAEGAATPQIAVAQGGLVDDLERQSRGQLLGLGLRPTAEQFPGSQAQMFGQQQPDADLIAGDTVGQQLTDPSLQALRVGRLPALPFGGALGEDSRGGRLGVKGVEFFFAGRSRR